MEEKKDIFTFENTIKLPKEGVWRLLEWKGKLVSAHGGGVYLTKENESKELWNKGCYCVTIWNGNLVCGGYGVISIWNSEEKCIMELKEHIGWINSLVEWNELLVSGSEDKTIKLWDRSGKCIKTLKGHTFTVYCLLIWNNNLISGSYDKTIIIWNLNGDILMKLNEHTDRINSLVLFNNNLVSGSYDKTIRIWSNDGKCIKLLNKHNNIILTLLEWNEYLISADNSNVICIWDKNMNCLQEIKEKGGSRLTKWKGKLVCCGSFKDTNLNIWKFIKSSLTFSEKV